MSQPGESVQNPLAVLSQIIGRPLLTPTELFKELHQADWPDGCTLHPVDFLALGTFFALAKDDDGFHFTLANTTIRPRSSATHLSLTDYAGPAKVALAHKWER